MLKLLAEFLIGGRDRPKWEGILRRSEAERGRLNSELDAARRAVTEATLGELEAEDDKERQAKAAAATKARGTQAEVARRLVALDEAEREAHLAIAELQAQEAAAVRRTRIEAQEAIGGRYENANAEIERSLIALGDLFRRREAIREELRQVTVELGGSSEAFNSDHLPMSGCAEVSDLLHRITALGLERFFPLPGARPLIVNTGSMTEMRKAALAQISIKE